MQTSWHSFGNVLMQSLMFFASEATLTKGTRMNVHECTWINLHAISRVNLQSTFLRGGTPFGLNPLQAPTPVEKKKQQQATKEP